MPGLRFVRDPELPRVSRLIESSWAEPRWVYDVELLHYYLRRPSADPDLLLGLEDEATGELVGYYALLPLRVTVGSQPRRAVFGSFLTSSPRVRRRGLTQALHAPLLGMALEKGSEVYLAFCEVGAVSNDAITRSCEHVALTTTRWATFPSLGLPGGAIRARALPASPMTRPYRQEDELGVQALLERRPLLGLHREIPLRDYGHRFTGPRARAFVWGLGEGARAFAHLALLEVRDAGRVFRNAYLQDLEASDLQQNEARQFLSDVLRLLQPDEPQLVLAPGIGYFPGELLASLGFRRTARQLNLLGTVLRPGSGGEWPAEVQEFCLDVF